MSQMNEIENDVLEFLSKSEGLRYSDKKELLMLFFKKHLVMNQGDLLLSYDDMQQVISNAKSMYSSIAFPVRLQDSRNVTKELTPGEIGNYCVAESMISLLNRNEALKRLPVFKKGR